jgi:hypothetical protein
MTDIPRPAPPDDDALLSAYLEAELGAEDEADLEARLAAEPALLAALEAQRALQERFALLAGAELPEGAGARLRDRLAAEQARTAPEGGAPPAAPTDLAGARTRRRPGGISWGLVSSAAAALVAVAVVGAGVLRGGQGDDADTVAMDATTESAEQDSARRFLAGEEGMDTSATRESAQQSDEDAPAAAAAPEPVPAPDSADPPADGSAGAPRALQPMIVDDGVVLADADAVRAHLAGKPEVAGLLGTPGAEADDLAAAFTVAVQGAEPFADGTRPDVCLATVSRDAAGPAVPARVEALTYQGAEVLGYLLVVASRPGGDLDRVEAWIVTPSCATQLFLSL